MKKAVFTFVVLLLLIPLIVGLFSLIKDPPLAGVVAKEESYTLKYFTWSRWFDDRFQQKMEKEASKKTGFRNTLIRIANHLDFELLKKIHADKAILGKDNYLFEEGYIIDYLGRNYLGADYIKENLRRFKMTQEVLRNRYNVQLLLVLEPGKAGTYPEKIPMQYQPEVRTASNYQTYKRVATEMGISCLDLQSYFTAIKDTSKYPLYPKYGVHWSTYGMWLAADTLLRFVKDKTGCNVGQLQWHGISKTDKLKDVDFDLEKTINLLYELPHEDLAYPQITFDTSTQSRPRVLTVADSYYWSFFDNRIPQQAFANSDFWYYNATIYPHIWGDDAKWVKDLDVMEQIKSNQVILFMITEMNLYKSFWGFTDTIIAHEIPEYKSPRWFEITQMLVNNENTYKQMLTYCNEYHKSFDFVVSRTSRFIANAEKNYNEIQPKYFWIALIESKIYNDPEYLNACREKANNNNISLLKSVFNEAVWLFQKEAEKRTITLNI